MRVLSGNKILKNFNAHMCYNFVFLGHIFIIIIIKAHLMRYFSDVLVFHQSTYNKFSLLIDKKKRKN